MALYPAPATTVTYTAAGQAELIKQGVSAMGDSVLQQYTTIKGYITAPGVTRAQTITALGSDASPLNTVATNVRTLLASIDAALGTKYDAVGAP